MALPSNYSDGESGRKLTSAEYNAHTSQTNTHTTQIASNTAAIIDLGGDPTPAPVVPNLSRVVDYGFCQSEIGHESWYSTGELRSILEGIKAAGATRVRFAAWWSTFEPTSRGVYDWDGLDRAINLCEEYGLVPLVCPVSPGPAYASPTVADYANACGDLAARYGAQGTGQVKYYEIWNEPNHRSFYEPFDASFGPTHYTSLLIAASNAIRAADSGAFIITAGLMSTVDYAPNDILPSTFLQGIYAQGGQNYFDAVGFHWYVTEPDFTGWVEPAVDETFYVDLLACYDIMVAEGDADKKIWITELGIPEPEVDAVTRGERIAKQIDMLRPLDFIENVWLYNYRCTDNTLTGTAQYGAVTFDFVERQPCYDYIASINSWVKGPLENSITGEHLTDDSVGVTHLDFTGTTDGTTYARSDGTWAVPAGTGGGGSPAWVDITGKPSTFAPSTHTHAQADVTGLTAALATKYGSGGTDVALADGGTGTSLTDPNADRILFWDDSAGVVTWLTPGTNLTVTGTTIDAAGGGGGGGSFTGYSVAVGAVTANTPVTITHSLGTRSVSVVVRRTHLVSGGLTDTEPGEEIGVKWTVASDNAVTLDPSENWAANEFFCVVAPMGVTDSAAPGAPTLSTTAQGSSTIDLSVTGATGSPVGYNWYRPAGGALVGTTSGTTFQDTGLTGGTSYNYNARAFNLQGRESSASNTVTTSTTGSATAVLDAAGAGSRVTGTNTITASQVVSTNANKHLIAYVVISQNAWIEVGTANSDFSTMTLTSNLSGAMTKLNTTYVGPAGQAGGTIHLYELDNPANGTHTLTLGSVPTSIAPADQIMIFSGSYHNVASVANINSFRSTTASTLNQNVTSATGNLAVCCVASDATAVAGFNKTTRDSDGSVLGTHNRADFGLYGEAAGAATVNFTTSNSEWHGFLGANLVKA